MLMDDLPGIAALAQAHRLPRPDIGRSTVGLNTIDADKAVRERHAALGRDRNVLLLVADGAAPGVEPGGQAGAIQRRGTGPGQWWRKVEADKIRGAGGHRRVGVLSPDRLRP